MFRFIPWSRFEAFRDRKVDRVFLTGLGRLAAIRFMDQQTTPKHGRTYYRRGKVHRASAPGEYPAKDTGLLRGSEDFDVGSDRVVVGNTAPYAGFLRNGTSRMARRKMSDNALSESTAAARPLLRGFVKWRRS